MLKKEAMVLSRAIAQPPKSGLSRAAARAS
jgi:hypothetical protein